MADVPSAPVTDTLLEWWHVAIFAVTTVIGYAVGTAKRGWTMEQLQAKLTSLEDRVNTLARSTDADSRTVGLLGNDLTHIKGALAEIKQKLETMA